MRMLEDIRVKILSRQFEFSKHAVDQSIIRDIAVAEVEQAISSRCEVIEDPQDDNKYGPSCLILGFTEAGRPLPHPVQLPQSPAYQDHHLVSTRSELVD